MPMAAQFLLEGGFHADQQDVQTKFTGGQDRAFHFSARGMVASHSIYCDGGHLSTSGHQWAPTRKAGEGET